MEFVGILQSARFGFEVNTEYSLMLYCSASTAQVVAGPVVTLRPTMLQSAAGAALEFEPNP